MSFIATANSIIHAKGLPVFADIEMSTYNIDPKEIAKKINEKTSCVMPVHLYGYPAKMEDILDLAKNHNLSIVEDACQAHGAEIDGKRVGSFGNAAAFSFYPSKNMTVGGDGGMITTNDEKIANLVTKLRHGGRVSKYEHDVLGYTSRMSSAHAAIGRIQLKKLNEWNERRRKIAKLYSKLLSDTKKIILPPIETGEIKPVYHLFVIRTKERDKLAEWLNKNEIETGVNYPIPIHLQPLYKKMFGYFKDVYKNSEELSKTCLSLPIHPKLSDTDVKFVCEKINEFFCK
jgi:dTDP-4-amino-4,6-dideoxygalactose transaminase